MPWPLEKYSVQGEWRWRIKHSVLEPAFPYPPIPEEVRDSGWPPEKEYVINPREVPKTASILWGLQPAATARAHLATEVTPENEALLRTFHRSLKDFETVEVYEDSHGSKVWKVFLKHGSSPQVMDTHAGGREIHIAPICEWGECDAPFMESPIFRRINPRRMLTAQDLQIIRYTFPGSVGVRVFVAGLVVVLFDNWSAMEKCRRAHAPNELGLLRLGYDIAAYRSSATRNESVCYVTQHSSKHDASAALGLRLKLRTGEEVITAVTHPFVRSSLTGSYMTRQLADWCFWIRDSLRKLRPVGRIPDIEAGTGRRHTAGNTPLGVDVGTITKTYDPVASGSLSFPGGFLHDLSLVRDDNLPTITSEPPYPTITGWANYSELLDGAPIFVCRINTNIGSEPKHKVTRGIIIGAERAVVVGTEYTWDRKTFTQNASILWRTERQECNNPGYFGRVLCVGKTTDATAKAVLFQNFESPMKTLDGGVRSPHLPAEDWKMTIEGGFLLPEEIRQSTIQMGTTRGGEKRGFEAFHFEERKSTDSGGV